MTRQTQCTHCHRFLTGAPSPEVGHQGVPGGSICPLQHHPNPCPWTADSGTGAGAGCDYYANIVDTGEDDEVDEVAQLRLQLQHAQSEIDDGRRQVQLLQLANTNLTDTHSRLASVATATTTTTTTTSTTVTGVFTAPLMGTGYSASLATPSSSLGMANGSTPAHLSAAAASLVAGNSTPASQPTSIYGYGGPTIPELRGDPNVSSLAHQVFSLLVREIPALAAVPSTQQLGPPPFQQHPTLSSAAPSPQYPVPPFQHSPALSLSAAATPHHYTATAPPGPPVSTWVPSAGPSLPPSLHRLLPQHVGGPPPPPADPQLDLLQRQIDEIRMQRTARPQDQDVQTSSSTNVSLESLFSAHIKCPQYKALDFVKLGKFNYTNQVKSQNLNLALFSYGSLKHLLALSDGTLPPVSKSEYISRLYHLINVFEISCLASGLTDFDSYGWRVAREYDSKVLSDIEHGLKTWDNLGKNICPMSWQFAKELVPKSAPKATAPANGNKSASGNPLRICTTWNTYRKENICHYESTNPGESCVFSHICSKCYKSKGVQKRHKAWQCTEPAVSGASAPPPSSTATPVTSV